MVKNAIILHGMPTRENYYSPERPSQSNSHWLPWLAQQLIVRDILAVTPEIPYAYEAEWEKWKREVERFEINENTMAVGHSCGGGFWLRYLSERRQIKINKLVLIAPSQGLAWDEADRIAMFGDFKLDENLAKRTAGTTIFNSIDDREGIQQSVAVIRKVVKGLKYREFKNYGHFTSNAMGSTEFPELLEELLS